MEIRYAKVAAMALQSYKKSARAKILDKIQALTEVQSVGRKGIFRLRVNEFRVKCEHIVDETAQVEAMNIIDIDSRGEIYKPGHIPTGMYQKAMLFWDKDFSRLTLNEARRMKLGRKQLAAGEYYLDSEIDMDNLNLR